MTIVKGTAAPSMGFKIGVQTSFFYGTACFLSAAFRAAIFTINFVGNKALRKFAHITVNVIDCICKI